jgi:hypothetical protein
MGIDGDAHGLFGEADFGDDFVGQSLELNDGQSLGGEPIADQGRDLLIPKAERRLPAVPIREAPNPLGQVNAIILEPIRHGQAAPVDSFVARFG